MSADQPLLSGRVALVTGSTSGIDHSIAHRIGSDGATVAINGRSMQRVADVVAELVCAGVDAFPAAYPLLARNGGVIVSMSSIVGHTCVAERASYVNGTSVVIDGGWLVNGDWRFG